MFDVVFRRSTRIFCLALVVLFAAISVSPRWIAPETLALASMDEHSSDETPPTLRFNGLRHYIRVVGLAPFTVTISDDTAISRVEFYLDTQLLSGIDVVPNVPTINIPYVWNSALATNGKHTLRAKAFDTAGNSQTIVVVVICHNFAVTPPTGNNISLNPATVYQTMSGWEVTGEAGQLHSPAWNNYKNALLDQAVNDLGINRIRAEIKSGIENPTDYYAQWRAGVINESQYNSKRYEIINDNSNPNTVNPNGFKWTQLDAIFDDLVIPLKQRLSARGENLWVSICYVDFGSSAFEHKDNPAEYAEFVTAAYQHIQARYGFVPNSWEIILEPDTETAAWSAEQLAQAVRAAGDRLGTASYTPNFVGPSTTSAANAPTYIDQIAQTTGAMQYMAEFSYHRYCCATTDVLTNIANRAVQHNKRVGMLEWIGADYVTLHQDLKVGRNSSWQQFTLAFPNEPDNGGQYYLITDLIPTLPIVTMGSRTKMLRQYFKFIRVGAQRIQAMTGNSNFDPLAFINPDGKYVVVVKTNSGGTFNVHGLPAGTYGIKYSTDLLYDVNLPDVSISSGQAVPANILTSGVITIYRR